MAKAKREARRSARKTRRAARRLARRTRRTGRRIARKGARRIRRTGRKVTQAKRIILRRGAGGRTGMYARRGDAEMKFIAMSANGQLVSSLMQ